MGKPCCAAAFKIQESQFGEHFQRDAFAALYPYLNKLVLPAGVIDMAEPRPSKDVLLIASKSSLVARDLHPAIQYLLLQAADEIHSMPGMFHAADQFPAPESIDLPLSLHAREFYKTGCRSCCAISLSG
jgi:hypothetical protein